MSSVLARLACVLAFSLAASAMAAERVAATVEQPRPFGHVIGDVLTQRILLAIGNEPFEPASLPAAERVGAWFERRDARIQTDSERRRWLVLRYQLINVPGTPATLSLPGVVLQPARTGGRELAVDPWPVGVAPLTGRSGADGASQAMQPDRSAPLEPIAPLQRRTIGALVALALTVGAWVSWWLWRNRQDARHGPFARAWRELKHADGSQPRAWLALHRAINRTAGEVVQGGNLDRLFARAPWLEAFRAELLAFHAESDRRFFRPAQTWAPYPVGELCQRLRDAEKRNSH